jgi:hypothetical protein
MCVCVCVLLAGAFLRATNVTPLLMSGCVVCIMRIDISGTEQIRTARMDGGSVNALTVCVKARSETL